VEQDVQEMVLFALICQGIDTNNRKHIWLLEGLIMPWIPMYLINWESLRQAREFGFDTIQEANERESVPKEEKYGLLKYFMFEV
jgi:hypothetical protein